MLGRGLQTQADPGPLAPPTQMGAPRPAVGPDGKIRVALLLPLSGNAAGLGRAMQNAAQLALFEARQDRLEIVPRDTRGTVEGAAEAARTALAQGASLILGPLSGPETAAVAAQARPAGVNVISFSTDRAVAGNGVHLIAFLPRDQVRRVVAEASTAGAARFAVLAPENPYGQLVAAEAQEAVRAVGGELVQIETYGAGGMVALTQAVQRLGGGGRARSAPSGQQGRFDAILIADGGERLRAAASLLPYYNINSPPVRLLGTGLWADQRVASEPSLAGGWFAAPPDAPRQVFEQRYQEAYGARPPVLAGLAYDAAALAAVLASDQSGPSFSAGAIANPDGFAGANGIFRFLPDGTNQRGLAVFEVVRGGFRAISAAPDTFEGAGF
ncbi:MAG: penicillin-binding protein activator [Alphaproteobacteria bacterium]|nr:penicillin-binding protein activator [Alphaproteobacteria bacterium]